MLAYLSPESKSKRKRLSISSDTIDIDEDSTYKFKDASKFMILCDELKIKNERLSDQIKNISSEHQREKEKYIRQIEFLDSENDLLRKSITEKSDSYFEDKKKWKEKQRSLENERDKAIKKLTQNPSNPKHSPPEFESNVQEMAKKLSNLEEGVKKKSSEVKNLSVINSELEEKIILLEIKLKEYSIHKDNVNKDSEESKDLRRRCNELEVQIRRNSRENEKNLLKIKNQILLEEQIASLNNKIKTLEEKQECMIHLESKVLYLENEKSELIKSFKDVLSSSTDNHLKQSELTPMMALKILSASQNRCAVLLRAQSELETNASELTKRVVKAESSLAEAEKSKKEANFNLERIENKLKLAQQQSRLYEKEVKSLRALLQSFDAEFKIGKPEKADKFLISKDNLIEDLRQQLDLCRDEMKELFLKIDTTIGVKKETVGGDEIPPDTHVSSADKLTIQILKEEIQQLKFQSQKQKDELLGLQKLSGVDFLPDRTRVLHMVVNPSNPSGHASQGNPVVSTLESMRYLREENRRLQDLIIQKTSLEEEQNNSGSNSSNQGSNLETSVVAGTQNSGSSGVDSNKLNQRLKDMFKERITCFREAVYLLTGYKIDLYSADPSNGGHPRLRLRSMYAENPDDSLLFQWKGSTLELIETEFAKKLDPRLFTMLSVSNSVPAFLSNVTLELFESQTFMG